MVKKWNLLKLGLFLSLGVLTLSSTRGYAISPEQLEEWIGQAKSQEKITQELATKIQFAVFRELLNDLVEGTLDPLSFSHSRIEKQISAELTSLQSSPMTQDRFVRQFEILQLQRSNFTEHAGEQAYWNHFFERTLGAYQAIEAIINPAPKVPAAPERVTSAEREGGGGGSGGGAAEAPKSVPAATGSTRIPPDSVLALNRRKALEQQAASEATYQPIRYQAKILEFFLGKLWGVTWFGSDRKSHRSNLGGMGLIPFGREYSVAYADHQGARGSMEDAFTYRWYEGTGNPLAPHGVKEFGVIGILDGHGGDEIAKQAARMIPDIIAQFLAALTPEQLRDPDWVRKAIENSFSSESPHLDAPLPDGKERYTVDHGLKNYCLTHKSLERQQECLSTGSTALIAVMIQDFIYMVNLGDSRAILIDSDGKGQRLACEHKPEDPLETEAIVRRGGFVSHAPATQIPRVDGYLATSRSLGDWFKRGSTWGDELHIGRRPDITVIDLSEEKPKALILTCDGVTEGVKSDRLIAELVLSQMETDLKVSARNLAAYALAGDSQDNVSVLVIQLKKE